MTTETIYDQYGRSYQLPGVYSDFDHHFTLTHTPQGGGDPITIEIDEPAGWKTLRINLKRSAEWHSVSHEYTGTDNACEFDGNSGRDFVDSIFNRESEDATILLSLILRTPQFDVVIYRGRLNLATYQKQDRLITCALERDSLHSLVEAKWDKDVSVLAAQSLDGQPLTPPDLVDIPLSSQALEERFVCNVSAGGITEQTFGGDTNGHIWTQFDTSKPQVSEIEELAGGKTMGLSDSEGPIANQQRLFKFRSGGVRQIDFEVAYRMWVYIKKKTVSIGAAYITGYQMDTFITVVKANGSRKDYPLHASIKHGTRGNDRYREGEMSDTADGKVSLSIDTEANDELYLYGLLSFDHNKNDLQQTQVKVQLITQRLKITGRTHNTASSAKGFALIDALNATLSVITGKVDRLRSDFYGRQNGRYAVSGCGSARVVMNGFAIRKFKPTEKPLTWSLRDSLQSLQAIDCIGMEYGTEIQPDGTLTNIMRVEPIEYYYRKVELLRLDEVGDYKERAITDEIISKVDVGYNDWIKEGAGALEEIFTTHQVQTPIRHEQASKSIVSKFITSSVAIERTRRAQFDETQKDGTTYDDKTFLIQCKTIPTYTGAADILYDSFLGISIILLNEPLAWLARDGKVVLGGSTVNKGTYTVTFVADQNRRPWSFYVDGVLTPETVLDLSISATGGLDLQPEVGADFAQVSGLPDSSEVYNLRISPGRMLLRNIPVWAGALIGKKGAISSLIPKNYPYQGTVTVTRVAQFLSEITLTEALDWITPGAKLTISGPTANAGTVVVQNLGDPTELPWKIYVVGALVPETVGSVTLTLPDQVPSLDQITKTKLPGNQNVSTTLSGDSCAASGIVKENAPIDVDQIIPQLLYRPREISFKVRLSQQQLQRVRLGLTGLLPAELNASGLPVNRNNGYISLLNDVGVRVAGYVMNIDYSWVDEEAVFILKQTALDLNDTTSGLDCSQFEGWTIAQAEAADAYTRRRIELCRWIDVDPM